MKFEIKEYKNFGQVLFCTNKGLTLGFTLDIGPRIIYAAIDGDNIFYNDTERRTSKIGAAMEEKFGKGECWQLFGGHRVWLSPEKFPDTYRPDSKKVTYTVNNETVTVKGNEYCGIVTEIEATFTGNNTASVINRIYNNTPDTLYGSVWALSVMDCGGVAFALQDTTDKGLLHNRTISLWSYTDIRDERLVLNNKYISVTQDGNCSSPLKIGINNTHGICAYYNRNKLFSKRFYPNYDFPYPDGNVDCEIYTCEYFTELETLSHLSDITPYSFAEHREDWSLTSIEAETDIISKLLAQ